VRHLSALDASFIYLESDHSPMHIGGVYLLDAADAPPGFGFDLFRAHIEQRLPRSRIFRERLIEPPLGLSHPCWINDPDFMLERHVLCLRLPAPGGRKELMRLAAQVFGRTLDRGRPLWEMNFVEGLDGFADLSPGSYALISKVHHAAVDGGSGVELMTALLDTSPKPRPVTAEDDWRPEPVPSTARLIGAAYAGLGRKPMELGRLVGDMALGAARIYGSRRAGRINPPPMLLTAPPTRLNRGVTSSRTYWGSEFAFDRFRRLREQVPGVTVNDIVLSLCAGALRDYLAERGELPHEPLVAMAPVSVRRKNHKADLGNQVSAMLVSLATDVPDPLQRLLQLHRNTTGSKIYSSALPANRIAELIPSETLAAAARVYTRMRLGGRHRPFFNLIITNVPGPPVPLYLAGARLASQFGMAPIMDGLGLIVVVLSYAGSLSISLTSCYRVVPDPEHLCALMETALAALERAVDDAGEAQRTLTAAPPAGAPAEPEAVGEPLERLRAATRELDRAIAALDRKLRE
jgi:WS/DGAT/MGAT family acyltransferase